MKKKPNLERNVFSVYTEPYTKFVIQNLKDIKGKSESDVVNFILKVWIEEHSEYLEKCGISIQKAKKEGVIK